MHEYRVRTHAHTYTPKATQQHTGLSKHAAQAEEAAGYLSFLMDETWLEARSIRKESVLVCMWVIARIHRLT